MKVETVLAKYKSRAAAARELTRRGLPITRQAIQQWDGIVPKRTAHLIELVTNGKLKVEHRCYK